MSIAPQQPSLLTIKCVLVGESGVGKTSLLMRYSEDKFSESFISTVGVDFKVRPMELDRRSIKLQIWDTAGQERYRSITRVYYKNADGIVVVYDSSDRYTFEKVMYWFEDAKKFTTEDAVLLLIATKVDRVEERQVSYEEGKAFADSMNSLFMETSSKTNVGVDDAFVLLVRHVLSKKTGEPLPTEKLKPQPAKKTKH
eukprot:TRINITY_DN4092_c0_g1_i1.p1 TRINITY_DN4092_c0_g1~~TRINITY_DN4092_c0_g1_i1.p1  ORF type:complete len:198 (+),score=26.14 TRINITY_DN4092_c0_g1_i1:225-818(+)